MLFSKLLSLSEKGVEGQCPRQVTVVSEESVTRPNPRGDSYDIPYDHGPKRNPGTHPQEISDQDPDERSCAAGFPYSR